MLLQTNMKYYYSDQNIADGIQETNDTINVSCWRFIAAFDSVQGKNYSKNHNNIEIFYVLFFRK